jgi:hypothetical protein
VNALLRQHIETWSMGYEALNYDSIFPIHAPNEEEIVDRVIDDMCSRKRLRVVYARITSDVSKLFDLQII